VTAGFLAPTPIDLRVLGFTFVLSVAVAVLFGLWPAMRVGRASLADTLRRAGDARSLGGRGSLGRRRLLACAELALCVVLLAGSGLLVRSMLNLLRQDTGFQGNGVLTFGLSLPGPRYDDARRASFVEDLRARLLALPGVEQAATVSHLPLDRGDTNGGFAIIGREFPEGEAPYARKRIASPGYFEAMGVTLVRGRTFAEHDRAGAPEVVIITESLATRYWPAGDALGARVRFLWGGEGEQEVVGIVGDVKHDGLDRPADGMIFRPAGQFIQPGFAVVVKGSGDPLRRVDAVRTEVRALDPDVPVRALRTMDDVVNASVAARRTIMVLMSAFALLALALATVGVYAIAAQAVAQRTGEIGLRMAVGAEGKDVVRMIMRAELPVIAAGALAGLAGALAATRMLEAWLFGVAARDAVTLSVSVAILALVALLATWIPALRAARLDPLRALRMD
jgi:predicted permease